MSSQSSVGLVGLAVMGQNLARNIAAKKIKITVFNRTTAVTNKFVAEFGGEYLSGESTISAFVSALERPRKIIILVKAGEAVDTVINELTPLLEAGDTIIECGNSFYKDSQRRYKFLKEKGLNFIGSGISGGEDGALHGPSLMPGGDKEAWKIIEPIFKKIAAKDFKGQPCVTYIGENGAGHYVKMVHNGIEYGIMQLIAEAYDYLRTVYKLSPLEMSKIFTKYNKGKLHSYLLEITIEILRRKDDLTKGYLIDFIHDAAAQKGTGKWTSVESLDRGVALPTITEAVFARCTSAENELRNSLAKLYSKKLSAKKLSLKAAVKIMESALYGSILSSYAQGFQLLQQAAKEEGWALNYAEIARIWQGGCIIRADILTTLHEAYKSKNITNYHLLAIPTIVKAMKQSHKQLKEFVAAAVLVGIPVPAFSSALNYFVAMTQKNSSANMVQALRDFFGAHTYERTDRPGIFHTEWMVEEK